MDCSSYKEVDDKLPPLLRRKRTKVPTTHLSSSPAVSQPSSSPDLWQKTNDEFNKIPKKNMCKVRTKENVSCSVNISSLQSHPCTQKRLSEEKNGSAPNAVDRDLACLLMQQLTRSEHQNKAFKEKITIMDQKIIHMDEEICSLKKKVVDLELKKQEENEIIKASKAQNEELLHKYISIEKKISMMEETMKIFESETLEDAVLHIGDQTDNVQCTNQDPINCKGKTWSPESSLPSSEEFTLDFDTILQSIKELNLIAGEDETKMCYTKQGATFKRVVGIPLVIYANGLILYSGPFRPYSDTATQQFVQDILDGYFPSELQQEYPEGVPFQVTDKHEVMYKDSRKKWAAFCGTGYQLGQRSSGSSAIPFVEWHPRYQETNREVK